MKYNQNEICCYLPTQDPMVLTRMHSKHVKENTMENTAIELWFISYIILLSALNIIFGPDFLLPFLLGQK